MSLPKFSLKDKPQSKTMTLKTCPHGMSPKDCPFCNKSKEMEEMADQKSGNWIQGAIKKPGALHSALGVTKGKKIPASKLAQAAKSKSPLMRKRAALAKTLKSFHK